jgi:hypothetical protein
MHPRFPRATPAGGGYPLRRTDADDGTGDGVRGGHRDSQAFKEK